MVDWYKSGSHLCLSYHKYLLMQSRVSGCQKTLNNHRGRDWVMRCRSQAEMDQLVRQAGFQKVSMRIDRFGIFTVSLAVKVAPLDDK